MGRGKGGVGALGKVTSLLLCYEGNNLAVIAPGLPPFEGPRR